MKIENAARERQSSEDWHWRYAWLPVRVSATRKVWLEPYYCRLVCTCEGGWAGGDRYRWEIIELGKGPESIWKTAEFCS
jgi:hypothetical protein